MKTLTNQTKKLKQVNNTPNPQKSTQQQHLLNPPSSSSHYLNLLKQNNKSSMSKFTTPRSDTLNSPNIYSITKNMVPNSSSSSSSNQQTPNHQLNSGKMLFFKPKILYMNMNSNIDQSNLHPQQQPQQQHLSPTSKSNTNLAISLSNTNNTTSITHISQQQQQQQPNDKQLKPTPISTLENSIIEFSKLQKSITPRNNDNQILDNMRPSPKNNNNNREKCNSMCRMNSAYKLAINISSPKLSSSNNIQQITKALSVDKTNSKSTLGIIKPKSIDITDPIHHQIMVRNDSMERKPLGKILNSSNSSNTITTTTTTNQHSNHPLKEEERCINHPYKKAKYILINEDGNEIEEDENSNPNIIMPNSQMPQRFCSKCAVKMTSQGYKLKEILASDEDYRKAEVEDFLLKLATYQRKVENLGDSVAKKRQDLQNFYMKQIEKAELIVMALHNYILEEKAKAIEILNNTKEQAFIEFEEIEKKIQFNSNEINMIHADIQQNLEKIIKSIEIIPFKAIISKYHQKLETLDNFIDNMNTKQVNISKLFGYNTKNLEKIKPIITSYFNIIKITSSVIKKSTQNDSIKPKQYNALVSYTDNEDNDEDNKGNNNTKNIPRSISSNNIGIIEISNNGNGGSSSGNSGANASGDGSSISINANINDDYHHNTLSKSSLYISFENRELFENVINAQNENYRRCSDLYSYTYKQEGGSSISTTKNTLKMTKMNELSQCDIPKATRDDQSIPSTATGTTCNTTTNTTKSIKTPRTEKKILKYISLTANDKPIQDTKTDSVGSAIVTGFNPQDGRLNTDGQILHKDPYNKAKENIPNQENIESMLLTEPTEENEISSKLFENFGLNQNPKSTKKYKNILEKINANQTKKNIYYNTMMKNPTASPRYTQFNEEDRLLYSDNNDISKDFNHDANSSIISLNTNNNNNNNNNISRRITIGNDDQDMIQLGIDEDITNITYQKSINKHQQQLNTIPDTNDINNSENHASNDDDDKTTINHHIKHDSKELNVMDINPLNSNGGLSILIPNTTIDTRSDNNTNNSSNPQKQLKNYGSFFPFIENKINDEKQNGNISNSSYQKTLFCSPNFKDNIQPQDEIIQIY